SSTETGDRSSRAGRSCRRVFPAPCLQCSSRGFRTCSGSCLGVAWRGAGQALCESSPTTMRVSDRYMYGGTSRLSGAGTSLQTGAGRSTEEPWQGQKRPPSQSEGSDGSPPPGSNFGTGEHPRCVQMPTTTRYSGLIERYLFFAYSGVGKAVRSESGSTTRESV